VAVGLRKSSEISQTFESLEKIWDEYDVYAKSNEFNSSNNICED
ncbi:MAG: N-acetylmannosamine kinase, partial [Oscillospiraceae bacterium]